MVKTIGPTPYSSPGGSDGKASAYNEGDPNSIPGWGRSSGEGNGNSLQYACLENPMDGWRSVVGYSPWGHNESDTTERVHFHFLSRTVQKSLPIGFAKWAEHWDSTRVNSATLGTFGKESLDAFWGASQMVQW